LLLWLDNKRLGISSTLRHICAACVPAKISLFNYDWKKEMWNIYFALGLILGGVLAGITFANPLPVEISQNTIDYLATFRISSQSSHLLPSELFNWTMLLTWKGFLTIVVGGFLVGFGTRYAQGCTSGHGILGLSALQWPSLVATASFFLGGILFSKFVLPYILSL
jgi:hypothetical protein